MSHAADIAILLTYLLAVVALGLWFARRKQDSDEFMAAKRSLPGWAIGLSIFGSYISSISFLANPGKSYAGNWNAFVFTLTTPIAAAIAVRWFVPFYRCTGEVSAYHHLEARFGPWARTYAVVCFLLMQVARTGTIIYLLAIALAPMLGVHVVPIILVTGFIMTLYPLLGGIEAAVWAGVAQSALVLLGAAICLVAVVIAVPQGLGEMMTSAYDAGKFSLGSLDLDFTTSTFWVVFLYGLTINLQNFGTDQSYVQRYITARSDRDARRSVWLGALIYVPVAAAFFFIGTALFAYYASRPGVLPEGIKPDDVFPHFIATALPAGLRGIVITAIFAAAMDSNLNNMATLTLGDLYKRYFRPQADERESMQLLRIATLFWGALGTGLALLMIRSKSVLDVWWNLAGIFAGGVLGLFLLGLLSRVHRTAAGVAIIVGVLIILWMSISTTEAWPEEWSRLASPFHNLMPAVVGTLAILLVGLIARTIGGPEDLTQRRNGAKVEECE